MMTQKTKSNPKPAPSPNALPDPGSNRDAGILLHITSLPSRYGIGDLGKEAYRFADQLAEAGQRWWQVLPLGPLSPDQCFSPYSSWSALGGNPLLISPELLLEDQLLTKADLRNAMVPRASQIDFPAVRTQKEILLKKAFARARPNHSFRLFCRKEQAWLNDFALFAVLKNQFSQSPWYQWPEDYKRRVPGALKKFSAANAQLIQFEKWKQYQFFRQWDQLKKYCNKKRILILGDIPVYVGYDSVDVWMNTTLFALEKDGTPRGLAGVPPDYFNRKGQLWGMPVYDWPQHQKENYRWWTERLRTNLRLFDKVRLDHFRAFASYWQVPAGETTAQFGTWKKGPGPHFFSHMENALDGLPFVAEDLGEIDESVEELRCAFRLPGMKVLQFGFGDDSGKSPHLPHHHRKDFIVYTGTHDNNTTKGWYGEELSRAGRRYLEKYLGFKVDKSNVSQLLIRMAYASVAQTVIVPLQDLLSLDGDARMNSPGCSDGNWGWSMGTLTLSKSLVSFLKDLTKTFDRNQPW